MTVLPRSKVFTFILIVVVIIAALLLYKWNTWISELSTSPCSSLNDSPFRSKKDDDDKAKFVATHVNKGCRPNLKAAKYYSQSQEDYALFKNYFNYPTICNGKYVEIGALDGIKFSNTKFFEDTLKWSGVLIEANPDNAKLLTKNRGARGRNVIIAEAVCSEDQSYVNFTGTKAVGGIPELMTDKHIQTFYKGSLPQSFSVKCRPIGRMLKEANITAIDLFVVDVEGAELMVLQTMDWSIPVKVFVVEMGRGERDQRITELLVSKGYTKALWDIGGFCLPGKTCTKNQVFENSRYSY